MWGKRLQFLTKLQEKVLPSEIQNGNFDHQILSKIDIWLFVAYSVRAEPSPG